MAGAHQLSGGAVSYDANADYYVLLGVPHTATHAEIRAAYRARIQHAHPDKSTGDGARAAALNVAWDVLGEAKQRAAYDDARRSYLAARAAAAATPRTRTRAKKARRDAASVAPKVTRPARAKQAAPSDAVDVAVENFVRSLQNAEYGKALGWFVVGAFISDARQAPARRPPRRRRRR